MSTQWTRDLRYYRLARHLRDTHGQEIPPGTRHRRRLSEELHLELHKAGCGHDEKWGLE